MQTVKPIKAAALATMSCVALLATGCSLQPTAGPIAVQGGHISGTVHGGQQPVSGATIVLYAAGTTGYGSAASSRLTSTVTTDSQGSFSITSQYSCPAPTSQLYILANGGNSGSGVNANLSMMAALGDCQNYISGSGVILINELTTVASVWALAPFMSGPANVGTAASNLQGLSNAFADVGTLVNVSTGYIPGPSLPSGATVPIAELNTLGDALGACVNSSGGVAGDTSACGKLFTAATQGSAPTDSLTAMMNIAQHPGSNVAAIYALAAPASPFQPTLGSAPNDFTVAVNFAPGNMNAPSAAAMDASGNLWITNSGNNKVTKLSHSGALLSGTGFTGSLNNPSAIAIDAGGNAWITDQGSNAVTKLTAAGTEASGSPYTGGGLNLPKSIAIDAAGNAWIANAGNASVTELNSTGVAVSGSSGYTGPGLTQPIGVAVTPH